MSEQDTQLTTVQMKAPEEEPSNDDVLMAEISGMLQGMPTEALAMLAARLQGSPRLLASAAPPPTAADPHAPPTNMTSGRASLLRHVLQSYLSGRVPDAILAEKVEELVVLVAQGTLSEAELFSGLAERYGQEVDLDPQDRA